MPKSVAGTSAIFRPKSIELIGASLLKNPSKEPMQAGQREYPATFPEQQLKPGNEADLEQAPMFEAPEQGSGKLFDRVALITGATPELAAPLQYSTQERARMSSLPTSTRTRMPERRSGRWKLKDVAA
jgi:hypothetical protein